MDLGDPSFDKCFKDLKEDGIEGFLSAEKGAFDLHRRPDD